MLYHFLQIDLQLLEDVAILRKLPAISIPESHRKNQLLLDQSLHLILDLDFLQFPRKSIDFVVEFCQADVFVQQI